ncbi:calcium-binding protein, partial [Methylobacterium sp. A54F]
SPSFSGLSDVAAGAGRSVAEAPVSFRSLIGQPGYYYNAASNILVITQDGASLRNIDFRGTTVYVQANNVTLAQSLFDASSASAAGSVSVRGFAGYANLTIDHASFDGLKRDKAYQPILGLGTNTLVSNSRFVDLPSDGISIASGRITGNLI